MKRLIHLISLILLVAIDQISKGIIRSDFADGKELTLIPGVFKFVFHKNDGAVWGIMSGKTLFLVITTAIILLFLLWFYFKIPANRRFVPLQFILVFVTAGALGNFIDRLAFGYVTDFLYFELIDFPVFNIADCYITVSAFLLVLLVLFYYKEDEIDSLISLKKHPAAEMQKADENVLFQKQQKAEEESDREK